MDHLQKYLPIVEHLAVKALDMAIDASPTKPRQGEHVRSLMEWVPVAKGLLEGRSVEVDYLETAEAFAAQRPVRFCDGRGHSRPHYVYLAAGLHRTGLGIHTGDAAMDPSVATIAGELGDAFELELLAAAVCEQPDIAADMLQNALLGSASGNASGDAPLHPLDADTSPDEWTFAEMSGLHGLFNAAIALNHPAWTERAHAAARYHVGHTQPDYTTYQPWALAAFLHFPDTVGFAEQQLHDVETHLHVEGPAGALVPGLLLADAVATLKSAMERGA